jgi:hypothetical protein
MVGFPPAHCRVAACAVEGNDGIVIADTGQAGAPYLYATRVERTPDGWVEGGSSNALGWMSLDHDLGNVALWDVAPAGADRVRVEFDGAMREEPVANGVYLLVWWRVPCPPSGAWPRVVAFRVGDVWEPPKSSRPERVAPGA